jgi:hypothetical protein
MTDYKHQEADGQNRQQDRPERGPIRPPPDLLDGFIRSGNLEGGWR